MLVLNVLVIAAVVVAVREAVRVAFMLPGALILAHVPLATIVAANLENVIAMGVISAANASIRTRPRCRYQEGA